MSELLDAATEARERAYAPYSNYPVGAAIRASSGRVYRGCNVENLSYPLSVCAERNAVAEMVLHGDSEIREVMVRTRDGGTPCGGCLQVLLEFAPEPDQVRVRCQGDDGAMTTFALSELIPHGFRLKEVQ
jgi:cytidine deaminase